MMDRQELTQNAKTSNEDGDDGSSLVARRFLGFVHSRFDGSIAMKQAT
jgi:hypothetical protein